MESAAYVARYIMKKQYKDPKNVKRYEDHYETVNTETGEIFQKKPEYSTMSRNIGREWFKKYPN